jgi:mannose-6-phosphate isomerase-like protein (cupin superfamily)
MARNKLFPVALVMVMVAGLLGAIQPVTTSAQDAGSAPLVQVSLEPGELPVAPSFVRLLRITMEPDTLSPLHTHPGPEFNLVESGTVRVLVQGKALLQRAAVDGEAQSVEQAPDNEEIVLRRGDLITYVPGTALTFRNSGTVPAVMLAGVVLPAGSQHPPGLVWVGEQPSQEDLQGVTSEVLGDGIATTLPTGNTMWTVEQVTLDSGAPLPASTDVVMYSLVDGLFDFTIESGSVQVSRIAEPGPRPESPAGTAVSLAPGDAAFFPNGVAESPRSDASGPATFYRVTLTGAAAEATGATPVADQAAQPGGEPAVIAIAATAAPTPAATEEATPQPEETATEEATEEATETPTEEAADVPTELAPGVIAVANDSGVRVRDQPTTNSNIVNSLDEGDRVRITGESVEADGFVWWPIEGVDDPTVVGWAAAEFLDIDENQEG